MSDTYLIPQFIIEYLHKSKSTKNPQKVATSLLKKYKTPEIENWFKENEVTAGYLWKNFVFYGLDRFSFRECAVCGKRVKLSTILCHPDAKYCSVRCQSLSKEVQEKYKQTCLEKYGAENPNQCKEVRDKIKRTNLEKYGVENSLQSKKVRDKIKQTCLEKYGVENASQSKEVQEKRKQTFLEKYGVEFVSQSKEVREKIREKLQSKEVQEKSKQTCLKRYGVEYSSHSKEVQEKIREKLQSKEVKDRMKRTNLEKYGVENASQSKEVQEKIFQTNRSNHWESFCSQLKKKDIIPLFSKEEYVNDTGRKFKCLVCGEEFESEGTDNYRKEHPNKYGSYTTLQTRCIYCPQCFKAPVSKKEKAVLEFVKSIYEGKILENDRKQLEGKELDIFLPELNLGIEFDENYWHSLKDVKENDEIKNQLCEQKGIRLLRIKESDWDNNPQSVKETLIKVLKQT